MKSLKTNIQNINIEDAYIRIFGKGKKERLSHNAENDGIA